MRTIRTLALIAMVIVGLNALEMRRPLTNAQVKKIENLKTGNSWGSLLVSLAEMHMLAKGPIEDLAAAIQAVIEDIETKIQSADADFERRTEEHNTEVRTLNGLINEAQRNIADRQSLIEDVLIPQRNQLIEEIANLNRLIEETKAYIQQATIDRQNGHSGYLQRVIEHNEAIAAIQEALSVLEQLNGETSLVQVKKLHKSVDKIAKNVQGKHFVEATFVKSLLALTNTEFVNEEQLTQVRNLLLKVLGNLQTSLETEDSNERKEQEEFQADIARQQGNIVSYGESIQSKTDDLSRTEEQITESREYIEERTADLASYNADLEAENQAYEEATNTYNDLVAQLNSERDAATEALSVIQNASIEDYIGGRIAQTSDHVIGTNHGSGVEVAGGRFQFN